MKHFKSIHAFSFWDFCQETQAAIQEGFVFSDLNYCMPTAFVGSYSCVMVKDTQVQLTNPTENAPEAPTVASEGVVNTEVPNLVENAPEAVLDVPSDKPKNKGTKNKSL